jgi:peroxiredoxin
LPRLNALYRRYRDDGLVVLGLNADAHPETARRVAAREAEFPCLFEAGALCADYGVVAFPTTFLVDRQGRVRAAFHAGVQSTDEGAGGPDELEHRLVALLTAG